jgi:hypothetical protein
LARCLPASRHNAQLPSCMPGGDNGAIKTCIAWRWRLVVLCCGSVIRTSSCAYLRERARCPLPLHEPSRIVAGYGLYF